VGVVTDEEKRLIGAIADSLAYLGVRLGGNALLYAEAGQAWAGGSVFIEHPDMVEWVRTGDHDVLDSVIRLWEHAPDAKKWRALTMLVGQEEFRTEFDFEEAWNEEEDEGDRRVPVVLQFFGDKPIVYPAWDEEGFSDQPTRSAIFRNC
jgi:hypothetical protein